MEDKKGSIMKRKGTIKKLVVLLVCCILCFGVVTIKYQSVFVSAATTRTYGNFKYTISNKEVTITKYTGKASKVTIPSKLSGYPVIAIGKKAFKENKTLKSVVFPSSITSIGDEAFYRCTKLSNISFPSKLKTIGSSAFYECTSLTSVKLPNTVTKLGDNVFWMCSSLKEVTLPQALTEVSYMAFADCAIESISLPNSIVSISDGAFDGCNKLKEITIPNSVTNLGALAFARCSKLTSISIPEGVTVIGDYTFCNCASLKEVQLSSQTTSIGMGAFTECESLEEVNVPDTCQSLGSWAFRGCKKLKEIHIPEGIDNIPYQCFMDCNRLGKTDLPLSLKEIEGSAFANCYNFDTTLPGDLTLIGSSAFFNCESLTEVDIPSSVPSIEYATFYNCKSLQSITLPETIKLIGENIFNGCASLEEITLPDGIEQLPTFKGCNSLKAIHNIPKDKYKVEDNAIYSKDGSVLLKYLPASEGDCFTVPEDVTSISNYAFSGALYLEKVEIPDTVTNIGIGLFYESQISNVDDVSFPSWMTKYPAATFYGCQMSEVEIPEQINEIGYQAFAECKNLKRIVFHKNICDVGTSGGDEVNAPYQGCDALEEFVMKGKSKYYQVIDGVLFENDSNNNKQMYLVCYPAQKKGTTYKVPKNTIRMYTFAFDQVTDLRELYLNDQMTGVWQYFKDCTNLKIYVPKTTTRFISSEHTTDWPIFNDCTDCYLYVKNGSKAHTYCKENGIPYKIWK